MIGARRELGENCGRVRGEEECRGGKNRVEVAQRNWGEGMAVLPLIAVLLILLLTTGGQRQPAFAFSASGSGECDGVYVCPSDGTCVHVGDSRLNIKSVYKLVDRVQQRRWYIYNGTTTALFGAIELSREPFVLKTWKRIVVVPGETTGANFDVPSLVLAPLPSHCDIKAEASVAAFVQHQLTTSRYGDISRFHGDEYGDSNNNTVLLDCAAVALQRCYSAVQLRTAPLEVTSVANALIEALATSASSCGPALLPACMWASVNGLDSTAQSCYWKVLEKAQGSDTDEDGQWQVEPTASSPLSCIISSLMPMIQMSSSCLLQSTALLLAEHLIMRGAAIEARRALLLAGNGQLAAGLRAVAATLLADTSYNTELHRVATTAVCQRHGGLPTSASPPASSQLSPTLVYSSPSLSASHSLVQHACHHLLSQPALPLPSASIVSSLLLLGHNEAATEHAVRKLGCEGDDCILPSTSDGASTVLLTKTLHLALLRACPDAGCLLLQSDSLALFLSVLMQVASPVTFVVHPQGFPTSPASSNRDLALRHEEEGGVDMATLLASLAENRRRLVDALKHVLRVCSAPGPRCMLEQPITSVGVRGLFLLAYQGVALSGKAGLWDWDYQVPSLYHSITSIAQPDWHWTFTRPPPGRTRGIRVGFVSAFLFRHPVGRLLGQISTGVKHSHHIVHVIDLARRSGRPGAHDPPDDLTLALQSAHGDNYHSPDSSDIVTFIRGLDLDVLVFGDVFMDALTAHAAMIRLAPVSVAFWGHPFSTGFSSIDYFISSVGFEETGDAATVEARGGHFSEQLVLFDSLTAKIFPLEADMLERSQGFDRDGAQQRLLGRAFDVYGLPLHAKHLAPHLTTGGRLYGCLQSLFKYHPLMDVAFLSILKRDVGGVLVLQRGAGWAHFARRLAKSAAYDRALLSRVLFLDPAQQKQYAEALCSFDVTLDTFPFGGGLTLVDALSCPEPVPFVTAGALQTVHMLGRGMAKALHSGNDSSSSSSSSSSVDACEYELGYEAGATGAGWWSGGRGNASLAAGVIEDFAALAVDVAQRRQACRTLGNGKDALAAKRVRVQRVLYDDTTGAVEEWKAFLHRVVVKL